MTGKAFGDSSIADLRERFWYFFNHKFNDKSPDLLYNKSLLQDSCSGMVDK